jgi:regulator of RNase E activity RraA
MAKPITAKELCMFLGALPAGPICDSLQQDFNLKFQSFSLPRNTIKSGNSICGPAFTSRGKITSKEDPLKYDKIRIDMLRSIKPGQIHVLSAYGDLDTSLAMPVELSDKYAVAHFGDITALSLIQSGCIGSIIDGTTRDIDYIKKLDYPISFRETHPKDSIGTWNLTSYGGTVTINGIEINDDSILHLSVDGVVVIPSDIAMDVLVRSIKRTEHENMVRKKMYENIDPEKIYREFGRW